MAKFPLLKAAWPNQQQASSMKRLEKFRFMATIQTRVWGGVGAIGCTVALAHPDVSPLTCLFGVPLPLIWGTLSYFTNKQITKIEAELDRVPEATHP